MSPLPKTILLIEDEPLIASMYAAVLTPKYLVATVHNKRSALESIQRERPDVVLLDLMIPLGAGEHLIEYDHPVGFDILEWIHHSPELVETKVIIITNVDSEDHKRRAAELGAVRYLVKAFVDPHDLVKHVDTIFAR